ncbi:hypothetical protein ABZ816_32115 [Actinosynnema sp. NPDC047251]|uniref:Uncharacterized protein n=1 Tax=Saccharothrix espanaensis (strain ATCC 51144 / DSM 44229 / JCM 9112 / NBRC 15066 / NRRL 15764) TaxID=1179773 RepID=K0K097_SACES|nr:hypothetical protein [Saccharothrix espanaensis]CCH29973.1 hypothetical protein BN6_26600 [Saccharothrix espanaensis DSM 44229]
MDDDELVERLRALAEPVPEHVRLAARAALGTRRLDEELAELVQDAPALVRAGDEVRVLTFEHGGVALDVQVDTDLRVLVTGASGDLVVESPDGRVTVPIGPDGWVSAPLPHRTLRLRVTGDDGRTVVTRWFSA